MSRELERDLGLSSVLAISIGAMVGSGIFILPALALKLAGPAVIVAYFLAGLIVLPAALSKAEMATAMPQAGGTYIYIERSMGPLLGTVAGIGTWFALTFKGALALVGGAPYIVLLFDLPVMPVAVGLAAALIAINMFGAKQTGRMQVVLVAIMLAAMGWFVAGSVGSVEAAAYEGFYSKGLGGVLAATGFVFVSYAGVTKIASVAEEIEDPGRNIPIGLLGSLAFTTALYILVVSVLVGVAPALQADLVGSNTPIADVAEYTLAQPGVIAVVVAAILALISTANAGLLSSSRYPFAMSRDKLAPPQFAHVSERFETPTVAIGLTGAVTILLVIGVPIMEIAKLGSAFQILVFMLINVALITFRQSSTEEYDPVFTDPLYPWTQAFGIIGGAVLLTQMGWLPMIGALAILAISSAWYWFYARPRVRREGLARGEMRRRAGERVVERTKTQLESSEAFDVVVAITEQTSPEREQVLIRLAALAAKRRGGEVTVVRFDEVPDQLSLAQAAGIHSDQDAAFEERMEQFADSADVRVQFGEVVTHDVRHSVVNVADHHEAGLLVIDSETPTFWSQIFGTNTSWVLEHAPCDVLVINADMVPIGGELALVTDQEPFEPVKIELADAFAVDTDAKLLLIQGIGQNGADNQRETVEDYHRELAEICKAETESRIVDTREPAELARAAAGSDWVMIQLRASGLSERKRRELIEALEIPTIIVRPKPDTEPGWLARLFDRFAF